MNQLIKALVTSAAVVLVFASADAQTMMFRITGKAEGDYLGESVDIVRDFNHDGYSDFIVGAMFDDTGGDNGGIARVYSGKNGAVLFTVTGDANEWVGRAVADAGDVNRDGYSDVIVGASGVDVNGTNSGRARVYSGKTGGLIWSFSSGGAFAHFGQAVAGAGDVDGDGYADLLVGAPNENHGTVHVYSGRTALKIWTFNGIADGDGLGVAVNSADVNGDGFSDIIAGAPYGDTSGANNGYVRVYSGRTGSLIWQFDGGNGDYFGFSVDSAGDFNQDGFDDVLVGAPKDEPSGTDSGRAFVYSGFNGALYRTFPGGAAGYEMGTAVAAAGDVLGDGVPAVLIGAPNENGGQVYVYNRYGLIYKFGGADTFAATLGGGGDLNHDGFADFIVGDPNRNVYGPHTGRAWTYLSQQASASRDNYGAGWPGKFGVPDFTASANPVLCSTIELELENSRGATTAGILMLGLSAASVPTAMGGTLLLMPHTILPIVVPSSGLTMPVAVICDTQFAGLSIFMQALEADPAASQGVSFTPGLLLVHGGTSPY